MTSSKKDWAGEIRERTLKEQRKGRKFIGNDSEMKEVIDKTISEVLKSLSEEIKKELPRCEMKIYDYELTCIEDTLGRPMCKSCSLRLGLDRILREKMGEK